MRKSASGIAMGLALTACGGGGTVSNSQPSGSYDLQFAMASYVRTASSLPVSLSGTAAVNGYPVPFAGTGTYSTTAGASGTFNGAPALLQTVAISGTVSGGGASAPYSTSVVDAYAASSGDILGQSQNSEYDTASAPIIIPPAVGATAVVLGTLNRYTSSTQSVALGTIEISVAETQAPVDPGSAETVQFTYKIYDAGGNLIETDTYVYSLTEAGALSFSSGTGNNTSSGTVTVTAQ